MTRRTAAAAALLGLVLSPPLFGQDAPHLLVVTGLGGSPEYTDLFFDQGATLVGHARDEWALPPGNVTWLAEDPALAPALIAGRGTREAVESALAGLAARTSGDDRILIVLIGHGTADGEASKLNLPGPDLTAGELAAWLAAFSTQTVGVVNTASASGGFLKPLSAPTRVVVTATRSAREAERTHFGGFFAGAYAGDGADTDKNRRVSLLEAFTYARDEVERFYERENLLLTEHATLEDPGGRAARFYMTDANPAGIPDEAADDPALAALLAERTRLETAIAELQARRTDMSEAEYDEAFESLAIGLARTNRAIREAGGAP